MRRTTPCRSACRGCVLNKKNTLRRKKPFNISLHILPFLFLPTQQQLLTAFGQPAGACHFSCIIYWSFPCQILILIDTDEGDTRSGRKKEKKRGNPNFQAGPFGEGKRGRHTTVWNIEWNKNEKLT